MKPRLLRAAPSVAMLLMAMAAVVVTAQSPQGQRPTFRAGVDVTPIDVTVVTSGGSPIADLKPGDFRVRVDGKERRVLRADWIPLARPSTTTPPPPPPEGYSSNDATTASGRLIVIAIDQPNIRFDSVLDVRRAVNAFIDHVQPSDPIAAVGLGQGATSTAFTLDRGVVKHALELMSGQSSRGNFAKSLGATTYDAGGASIPYTYELAMSSSEAIAIYRGDTGIQQSVAVRECWIGSPPVFLGPDNSECNSDIQIEAEHMASPELAEREQTLQRLQALLNGLARIDAPKTLVLVSEGFTLIDDTLSVAAIGSAAAAARTSVYAMKLDDIRSDASQSGPDIAHAGDRFDRQGGLELVASASRGAVFNIIGDGATAFAQLERELSGYYLVGVEAEASDVDGKAHPINVQVARSGAIVRARRELAYAAEPKTGALNATEELANALSSPLLVSVLPIRVATFALRDPKDSRIQLLIHADVGQEYTSGRPVEVAYVISNDKGTIVVDQRGSGRLPTAVAGTPSPLVYSASATLEPGDYTLKLAMVEGGRVGSVEHRVHAGLVDAGSFKLSELLIGGPIDARLILAPTVGYDVRFGSVQGYMEAYGANAGALTMRYELAPGLDAPSLFSAVVPGRSEGNDRTVFSYAMPVQELKPGEYFLRASASSGSSVVRKVARAFRVVPAPANATPSAATRTVSLNVRNDALAPTFRRGAAVAGGTLQPFRSILPSGAAAAFDEGATALASGDDAKAEQGFRKALEAGLAGADSTAALAYLGATYAASGKDVEAVGIWQVALVDGSRFPQLYEWTTDALLRLGNVDEARSMLEEAVAKWPEETVLAKSLALVYAKSGRSAEAVTLLSRHLTSHPDDVEALHVGVEWMFQIHQANLVLVSRADDVKVARMWADAYTKANGPESDTVKGWMLEIEK